MVEDEKLVNSYGIKESIDLIKTSTAYTYPQLDYTLSRFERYLYEQVQEAALVEDYLQAISAFTWDKVVKRSSYTVYARSEQYPVGNWVKRVNTGLAEQNETIEALEELTIAETQAPEVPSESVETRPEKKAVEEVVETPVEEVKIEAVP